MSIKTPLIQPEQKYSKVNEEKYRESIRKALLTAQNKNQPIIQQSPNGQSWIMGVDDTGNTTWTLVA